MSEIIKNHPHNGDDSNEGDDEGDDDDDDDDDEDEIGGGLGAGLSWTNTTVALGRPLTNEQPDNHNDACDDKNQKKTGKSVETSEEKEVE